MSGKNFFFRKYFLGALLTVRRFYTIKTRVRVANLNPPGMFQSTEFSSWEGLNCSAGFQPAGLLSLLSRYTHPQTHIKK